MACPRFSLSLELTTVQAQQTKLFGDPFPYLEGWAVMSARKGNHLLFAVTSTIPAYRDQSFQVSIFLFHALQSSCGN